MKARIHFSLGFLFLLLFSNCNKSIEVGESTVLMNGKIANYDIEPFFYPKGYNLFTLIVGDKKNNEFLSTNFSFTSQKMVGNLAFTQAYPTANAKVNASFGQVVDGDLDGNQYEFDEQPENFYKIELLDTIKREVKGSFNATFKKTSGSQEIGDTGLSDKITLYGVYYLKY